MAEDGRGRSPEVNKHLKLRANVPVYVRRLERQMMRTTRIVLLSSLVASLAPVAMAAPNQGSGAQTRSSQAAVPAMPPTQAQLRAMSTMRLLKLGQKALTMEMDTQDFVTGLDAVKIASARGDREATRL